MVDEVKFLKTSIDFDVLLATTRNAVELYFEGPGIPVNLQEEDDIKKSPVAKELEGQSIVSLIDGLSYRDDAVQEKAILLLIKKISTDTNEIREKGGIRAVVNLLNSPSETLQAHAAKALSMLSADDASKDAVRNCGAFPDIFAVLAASEVDRIKGLLLVSLLHLISCERNLPAIRSCGGIPIVLGCLNAKPLAIQIASAQIIATLSPMSESQYEITKAGGLRRVYKALRGDQVLQKEVLKILTTFSKSEKGKEYLLITGGCKYLLHALKPEQVSEVQEQSVRNSYLTRLATFFTI